MVGYSIKALLRDITSYTDEELEKLVDGIRERRLRVATQIGKLKTISEQARREKLEATLVKKSDAFRKKLEKVDELITELENRLVEVLALRIQLGDIPDARELDLTRSKGDDTDEHQSSVPDDSSTE